MYISLALNLLHYVNLLQQHFTFIKCLEETSRGPTLDKENVWRTCCQNLKLSPNLIKDCDDNGTGKWVSPNLISSKVLLMFMVYIYLWMLLFAHFSCHS